MPSLTRVQGRPLKRPQLSPRMLEKRRKAAIDWVLGDDSGGRHASFLRIGRFRARSSVAVRGCSDGPGQ